MASIDFDTSGLESYVNLEELEQDGIWFDFPGGRRFKVRRAGGSNRKFTRALQAAVKPYRSRKRGLEDLDPEVSDRLLRHVYAKTVISDWQGIRDSAGNDVPCTPENAEALFTALPELFAEIHELASNAATYSENFVREVAENLGED